MDDEDWDIGAIVRSCNINSTNNVVAPNLGSESQTIENDDENFLDKLLGADKTIFDDLVKIFSLDFAVIHEENLNEKFSNPTIPISMNVDQARIMDNDYSQQLLQPIVQSAQFSQQIFLPPSPPTLVYVPAAATTPHEWNDMQQQLEMQANVHPTFTLSMRTPLIQTPKRKNQEIKFIYELRQEELKDDTWTWHKYGEKSIKNSPFRRNYYRCSTSKVCTATKQIEKSPKDENLFLVAYSGVHNHPPPTNHRSRSGCNAKSFKSKLPKGINVVPKALSLNSSSKCSKRSRVATTAENKGLDEEEESVILISNKFLNEDILKGFKELKGVTSII